jgi:hypothetical protein
MMILLLIYVPEEEPSQPEPLQLEEILDAWEDKVPEEIDRNLLRADCDPGTEPPRLNPPCSLLLDLMFYPSGFL